MTAHPNAHVTARHNLAERIGRFLDALAKANLNPDYWEGEHIVQALTCLDMGEFPRGERAMMAAERPPQARSPLPEINGSATIEIPTTQLRAKLDAVMKGVA